MYIRRSKDEKRVFLVRGVAKDLHLGDGFTLVLDKYLYVLRRKLGTVPQFESVIAAASSQSNISKVPTSSSTASSTKHPDVDPFRYTPDHSKSSKPSAPSKPSNGNTVSKAPIDLIDEDDEEFNKAIAISRAESGITAADVACLDSTENDEEFARRMQAQFDAEDKQKEADARVAAATSRPTLSSVRHAEPTKRVPAAQSMLNPLQKRVDFGSSKPGDHIGASASNRLSSTPSAATLRSISKTGQKVVEIDEDDTGANTESSMDWMHADSTPTHKPAPSKSDSKATDKLASVRPKPDLIKPNKTQSPLSAPIPGAPTSWAKTLERPPSADRSPPPAWQSKARAEPLARPLDALPLVVSKRALDEQKASSDRLSSQLRNKPADTRTREAKRPLDEVQKAWLDEDEPTQIDSGDDENILGNLDHPRPSPSKRAKHR